MLLKKAILAVSHFLHLRVIWSKLYQWLRQSKNIGLLSWRGLTPKTAETLMRLLVWRKDDAKELWDAVNHPSEVDRRINEILFHNWLKNMNIKPAELSSQALEEKRGRFKLEKLNAMTGLTPADLLERLSQMKLIQGLGQPKGALDCDDFATWAAARLSRRYRPRVLFVYWSEGPWPWQIKGHAVCLYWSQRDDCYGYLGNWPMKSGMATIFEAAADIIRRAGKYPGDFLSLRVYGPEELML